MTASQAAKQAGFKSLKEVAELTGKSTQTLNNWYNGNPNLWHNPEALKQMLSGAITMRKMKTADHDNWEKIVGSAYEKYRQIYTFGESSVEQDEAAKEAFKREE